MKNKVRKRILVNEAFGNGSGSSSAETTITYDLTGATNINLSGYSGIMILNITTSNGSETLNTFTNITNVTKVILRPAAGVTLTIADSNAGGGGANIFLYAPELICYGSANGFLQLVKRGTNLYEENFIDQYNPLS